MSNYYLYPYKTGSQGASSLAKALEGKTLKLSGSAFKKTPKRHVINWGSCTCPPSYLALNPSNLTTITRDKLKTFRLFKAVDEFWAAQSLGSSPEPVGAVRAPRVPQWTETRQEALEWLSEGDVVCRISLTGQGGSGIVVVEKGQTELPVAPLYTKYVKKDSEYRVHVFKHKEGYEVIDVQRKIRNPAEEPSDWKIRSHDNGFMFARHNKEGQPHSETCPKDVTQQAVQAVACSGLDFGAVDVVFNAHQEKAYVLEINSAPGLEGLTVEIYRDALRKRFGT